MYYDVKDFLNSTWYARAEIERLSLRIKEMEAQAMKVTSQVTGMPRGGNADAQVLWAKIVDDTDKLYAQQNYYYDHVKLVEQFIDSLENDKHKEVLKLRYVNCLHWPEINMILDHTGYRLEIRQVFRIHGAALEEARRIWATDGWRYECTDKEDN